MTEPSPHQRWFYAAKSALSGRLIRIVLAVVYICVGCLLLFWLNLIWQQQTSLSQLSGYLTTLDRYLDGSKPNPPLMASAQDLFPDSVGQLKLEPQKASRCERGTEGQVCSAAYVRGSFRVIIVVRPLPAGYPESVPGTGCGGDIAEEQHIRKVGNAAYLYNACRKALFSDKLEVTSVMWANENWLFTVLGDFGELKEFLAVYPY